MCVNVNMYIHIYTYKNKQITYVVCVSFVCFDCCFTVANQLDNAPPHPATTVWSPSGCPRAKHAISIGNVVF